MEPLKLVRITYEVPLFASNSIRAQIEAESAISTMDSKDAEFEIIEISKLGEIPLGWKDQLPMNSEDTRTCEEYVMDYIHFKHEQEDARQMKLPL